MASIRIIIHLQYLSSVHLPSDQKSACVAFDILNDVKKVKEKRGQGEGMRNGVSSSECQAQNSQVALGPTRGPANQWASKFRPKVHN